MPKKKAVSKEAQSEHVRPALTPEARENQLISMAVNCAEKQLLDGTASPSVITHFLKLGTMKERLEREKLERENRLLEVKVEAIKQQERMEELYMSVLDAFREYNGVDDDDDYEGFEDTDL